MTSSYNRQHAIKDSVRVAYTQHEWFTRILQFGNCCAYCDTTGVELEKDHYVPLKLGGHDSIFNLVPACRSCNASKNDEHPKYWFRRQSFYSEHKQAKIENILSKDRSDLIKKLDPDYENSIKQAIDQAEAKSKAKADSLVKDFAAYAQAEIRIAKSNAEALVRKAQSEAQAKAEDQIMKVKAAYDDLIKQNKAQVSQAQVSQAQVSQAQAYDVIAKDQARVTQAYDVITKDQASQAPNGYQAKDDQAVLVGILALLATAVIIPSMMLAQYNSNQAAPTIEHVAK